MLAVALHCFRFCANCEKFCSSKLSSILPPLLRSGGGRMMPISHGYYDFPQSLPWLLLLVWIALAPGYCWAQCGVPGQPKSGSFERTSGFTGNGYDVGTEVSYRCWTGYTLFGPEYRSCRNNGTWSDVVPVCEENVALRKVATQQPQANYSLPSYRAVDGNRETYACIARPTTGTRWFKVDLASTFSVSSVKLTVDADRWYRLKIEITDAEERTKSTCKDVNDHLYDTINRFDCGRAMTGSKVIISDTATASTPASQANPKDLLLYEVGVYVDRGVDSGCGNPDAPLNGKWDGTAYRCDQGYSLQGDAANRCSRGVWALSPPLCLYVAQTSSPLVERIQGCGSPGVSRNGNATLPTRDVARYSCQLGYSLVGVTERNCQASGSWFPPALPKCVANVAYSRKIYLSDGRPGAATVDGKTNNCVSIQKGPFPKRWWLVDFGSNNFITNVTIALQPGNAHSLNVSFGWNVDTSNPLKGMNQFCHVEGVRATAPLLCRHPQGADARYLLIEAADKYGSVDIPFFLCDVQAFSYLGDPLEMARCNKPDEPLNGSAVNVTTSAGQVFRYQCQNGFRLKGSLETKCVNGQWNQQAPVCIGDGSPTVPSTRPSSTTTTRHWPTTDPRSKPVTTSTTPTDPSATKDPYYAGIIGIAVGATVASVSIVLAIVIVVCLLKKHLFKHPNYDHTMGSVGYNRENSTSTTYGPQGGGGSQRSDYDYAPQNHVYDVIKPLDELLPGHYLNSNGELTVPNDAYVNNSPSLNANRANHPQHHLPEHVRYVPARRQTPLYDVVASEELQPLADEPLPKPPTAKITTTRLPPVPLPRSATTTLVVTPQTSL